MEIGGFDVSSVSDVGKLPEAPANGLHVDLDSAKIGLDCLE
jgi:hypothetical protein